MYGSEEVLACIAGDAQFGEDEEFDASLLGFFYDAFDFLYVILHIGNACCGNGGRHGDVSKVRHRLILLRNVV